jgi:hypothetical protein
MPTRAAQAVDTVELLRLADKLQQQHMELAGRVGYYQAHMEPLRKRLALAAPKDEIMHFEVWGLNPGNLIATAGSQPEAIAVVRDLLRSGWSVDNLALGFEPDDDELGDGPPFIQGEALLKCLEASQEGLKAARFTPF